MGQSLPALVAVAHPPDVTVSVVVHQTLPPMTATKDLPDGEAHGEYVQAFMARERRTRLDRDGGVETPTRLADF